MVAVSGLVRRRLSNEGAMLAVPAISAILASLDPACSENSSAVDFRRSPGAVTVSSLVMGNHAHGLIVVDSQFNSH